jgi:hypothetical protein
MRRRVDTGICGNPGCNKEFTVKVPWQKYCSDECRLAALVLRKVQITMTFKKKS